MPTEATVSRDLPQRPHLDVPKREARELLKACRAKNADALARIRRRQSKFRHADDATIVAGFKLSDAQFVIGREYGYNDWPELKERIQSNTLAGAIDTAIRANDHETIRRILTAYPKLLHIPVISGNWGPPMSHAANLGRLETIKTIAALGARDYQHAFDRAILQGRLECARWLHEHGAKIVPGLVMGACETLNAQGLRFLDELGAPFTDQHGNPLAPLALALETYSRNPAGKHEVLRVFEKRGYKFPDTPVMAFHRGDLDRLRAWIQKDAGLVARRFGPAEIYPPELGCNIERPGMCGTPIYGGTLLHLAIDFDEQEIFDLLLDSGADVNARAATDADGFGNQTPIYNALISCAYICGRQKDAAMAKTLLARGASTTIRSTLRKFLDWRETPGWHVAREVTPLQWTQTFPEQGWVNEAAVRAMSTP